MLKLNTLILTQFKNYDYQVVECSDKLTCFVGLNGMGKTNLLDAIYYLCMGKSYFNSSDIHNVQKDKDFLRLEGAFQIGSKKEKVVVKVIPRKRKEVERNEVPYGKLSEHVGLIPVVIIAPDDTNIVHEGSEARRKFLDNTIAQLDPAYLKDLIHYNKLIKQRNALLKQFAEQRRFDQALIKVYDEQLLAPAKSIYDKRLNFCQAFTPVLEKYYGIISNEQEEVSCHYKSSLTDSDFSDLLTQNQEKDRILQRTTAGIHKDDLIFNINNSLLKRYASQGQLKSFVLALKLAQYEMLKDKKKQSPILLLDDIFDKLDVRRVTYLLQLLIQEKFGQIFITDTHEHRVEQIIQQFESTYYRYLVENGSLKKLH